jgi:hemolysin activation/secretion protein
VRPVVNRSFRLLTWVLLLTISYRAFGQGSPLDFERVAPKRLPETAGRVTIPSAPERAVVADETPVLSRLDGIVLLDQPGQVRHSGSPKVTGIKSEGSGLIASPKLAALLTPFLGKPANFGDLQVICTEIVRFYRDNNRPVVDAQLPEQEVTNGVLQVLVIEGRIGQVIAEGQHWFPENRLLRGIRSRPGDSIESNRLLDDIHWLNRNAFRHSDLLFRKGTTSGETDLVIKTTDRFPFRPYISYDNWGTDLTGNERWQTGFNWGDAFGLDQILSYQFSAAPDPTLFTAHAGTWTIPLPWRHVLDFYGSYSRSQPDTADTDFDAKSLQAGILYTIPLPNFRGMRHEVSIGTDFKQSNNNLLFGGTNIFASDTDIFQFRASYQVRELDSAGATTAQAAVIYSPGGITSDNTDPAFEEQRAFAHADYVYGRLTAQRTQRLPWNLTLVATISGQLANGNLLASEQFSLGGATSVRGYDETLVNGDRGWLGNLELYSPPISLLSRIRTGAPEDELKLVVFFDAGGASNVDLLPGENGYTGISGIGTGLRYRVNTWVNVRFDYAWSLQEIAGIDVDSSRAYISVSLSY